MSRRNNWLDTLEDILKEIGIVYAIFLLLFLWTNRPLFWKMLFWGLMFIGSLILTALFIKKFKTHKQSQWHTDRELLEWLRGLKPWEFEKYVADLFATLRYKTTATGGSYDGGVDVIAEKDGLKHYIQCKKYMISVVGVGELREFYGAIANHLAQAKGYFITTNKFTLEAERFAEDKPIELIDGYKLIKYIRMSEKSK